jgi:hypothetical protein
MYGNRVQITRDNKTTDMANNVYNKIEKILEPFVPNQPHKVDKFATLPLISVEQAIKELINLENEIK